MKQVNLDLQRRTHTIEKELNPSAAWCSKQIRAETIVSVSNSDLNKSFWVVECLTEDESHCQDEKGGGGLHNEDSSAGQNQG